MAKVHKTDFIAPDSFEPAAHFYPRVLNSTIHPIVQSFINLGNERIVLRYCHLHPDVTRDELRAVLAYVPKYFMWAGSDLFNVTTETGMRKMVVIETNSCPSGQKSMPLSNATNEQGGYLTLLNEVFLPMVKSAMAEMPDADLAVVYDKNEMEASGYAATLADLVGHGVHLVEFYHDTDEAEANVRWRKIDGKTIMEVRTAAGVWRPISVCFRYVTQKPWSRFPLTSDTLVLNPIVACLAGGRNKLVASKAYDFYNAELKSRGTSLAVATPETIKDVSLSEVPIWVRSFGYHAVIKVPYANAGQGVYTITSEAELDRFLALKHTYDKFIVQSLVGNSTWSSTTQTGKFYHVGTVPNKALKIFVADLRMMVCNRGGKGFAPIAIYARRAHEPLKYELSGETDSWAQLGTNLSVKRPDGSWTTESQRLVLMDGKDFNSLGIGMDDLIDAYVQTCLSVIAIDKLAHRLIDQTTGKFVWELYQSLCDDTALLREIQCSVIDGDESEPKKEEEK